MTQLERLYIENEQGKEIELVVVKRLEKNGKNYLVFYATNDPEVGNEIQAATLIPNGNGGEAFGEIETQEEMDFINDALNEMVESGEYVPEEGQGHDHDHDHDHHDHEHLYAQDEDGNEIVFAIDRRIEMDGKEYILYYDESEESPRIEVAELVHTEEGDELFPVDSEEELARIEAMMNDSEQ